MPKEPNQNKKETGGSWFLFAKKAAGKISESWLNILIVGVVIALLVVIILAGCGYLF